MLEQNRFGQKLTAGRGDWDLGDGAQCLTLSRIFHKNHVREIPMSLLGVGLSSWREELLLGNKVHTSGFYAC